MNKVPINDIRLTSTMERVRSGSTQLFREKNPNDRTFISSDNCDVSLNHENKAMYAELIDGQWYWVNGCAECNGNARSHASYMECDVHDRCESCGITRKEITGAVWGSAVGWICKPCKKIEKDNARKAAFEKLGNETPDCDYRDVIICPHCGSENSNDDMYQSQDIKCYVCEGLMHVEIEYTASYTTSVLGKRIKS